MVAGDASTAQDAAPRRRDHDARAGAARVRRRTLPSQVDAGVTHEAAGIILFKHIFRIAPQALPLFSFGRVDAAVAFRPRLPSLDSPSTTSTTQTDASHTHPGTRPLAQLKGNGAAGALASCRHTLRSAGVARGSLHTAR